MDASYFLLGMTLGVLIGHTITHKNRRFDLPITIKLMQHGDILLEKNFTANVRQGDTVKVTLTTGIER